MEVKLCTYISPGGLEYGRVNEDTCIASAEFSVRSSTARRGKLEEPQGLDEIMIREVIDKSVNE